MRLNRMQRVQLAHVDVEENHWLVRFKDSILVKSILPVLTNLGLLAIMAPLVQGEIGMEIWAFVLTMVVLLVLAYVISVRSTVRIHSIWITICFRLLIVGVIAILAFRPFSGPQKRTYVATTDGGLSLFDPQRYISSSKIISPDASLVVANHPLHRRIAGILSEAGKTDGLPSHWIMPFRVCASMLHRLFPSEIIFMEAATRQGAKVMPVALLPHRMEAWTDLAGAPCKAYKLTLRSGQAISVAMNLKKVNEREDGLSRMGTQSNVSLSTRDDELRFLAVARQEVLQWEDVALFGDFDVNTATYVACLAELLNDADLREHWAACQTLLWATVPNDRERLRLLVLRALQERAVAKGNVFTAQRLPDLVRIDSILAMTATSSNMLVKDQLIYWGAKNFITLLEDTSTRFEGSISTLKEKLKEVSSSIEPVVLPGTASDTRVFYQFATRVLPDALLDREEVKEKLDSFASNFPFDTSDSLHLPENPKLAWLHDAEWNQLKAAIPNMSLKRSLNGPEADSATAAAEARSPTLDDAWLEAESRCWLELLRRSLEHGNAPIAAMFDESFDKNLSASLWAVAEGAALQGALLKELVTLREKLFGDAAQYVEKSPWLKLFLKTSHAYAGESAGGDNDRQKASLGRLQANVAVWRAFLSGDVVKNTLTEMDMEGLGEFITEAINQISRDGGLQRVALAYSEGLDQLEFDQGKSRFASWLNWGKSLLNAPDFSTSLKGSDEGEWNVARFESILARGLQSSPLDEADRKRALSAVHTILAPASQFQKFSEAKEDISALAGKELASQLAEAAILLNEARHGPHLIKPAGEVFNGLLGALGSGVFSSVFPEPPSAVQEFLREFQSALMERMAARGGFAGQSASERHLWKFISKMIWFQSLSDDERPKTIVRDGSKNIIGFEPACPLLHEWIHEVATADTNGPEGSVYPYVSESLMLELILRTMADETPLGYDKTELGAPRRLFQTLTGQSVEVYIAECLQSAKELSQEASKLSNPAP